MKWPCSFNFNHNTEGLRYFPTINYNDEIIRLTGKNGFVLVNEPCLLVLDNRIFQFDDIDGKKLLPFFKKQAISIRSETEMKFLETFAKPVIQKYQVKAAGFLITDQYLEPQPVLSLETNLQGDPVLMLRFKYGEKAIYLAGRKSELLVTLSHEEHQIEFTRQP
jgi:hypothetical protein